jgi:hypothetical protein
VLVRSRNAPNWHSPKTTAYENEAELRDLIAHTPSLLPGIDERPVTVATEFGVPVVGQADVVVVGADGEITIVACKLAKNAEIRRWVIGQAFSYAAGLWRLGYDELEQAFAARHTDLTAPFTNDSDWDEALFRDAVSENLGEGAFRLVIAVDQITDELKRTVVYINRHTVPQLRLLALELRYAVDEGVEILLPEVYGEESADDKGVKRRWDEASFLQKLEARRGHDEARVAHELIEWARVQMPRFTWGTGRVTGSFIPVLDHAGRDYFPFALWTNGRAEIQFERLSRRPPFDDSAHRGEFLRRLNEVPGVSLPDDAVTRFPSIPFAVLAADPEALESLKGVLDWFCETVRSDAENRAED